MWTTFKACLLSLLLAGIASAQVVTGGSGGASSPTPGSQISFGKTVSPFAYGAKWDGKMISDAASTNTSSNYTCPNNDCGFTSADLGKIVIFTQSPASATPPCNGATCGTVIAQGFICTINSASSIVIGSTFPGCSAVVSSVTCAVGANSNCNMAWATQDDSTAINNAAAAAWNNGNQCLALELPSGIAFFSNPILNVTVNQGSPCAGDGNIGNGPGFADFSQTGPVVYGQGSGSTILIPISFPFASCTFGASTKGCNLATKSLQASHFQITGLGQSDNGTTHNVNLVEMAGVQPACTSTELTDVSLNQWEASSTGTVGLFWGGGCIVTNINTIVVEEFGTELAALGGDVVNLNGDEFFGCGGAGGTAICVAMNATQVNSTSSFFGNGNASATSTEIINIGSNALWNSFGDTVSLGVSNPTNGLTVTCGGVVCNMVFSGSSISSSISSGAASTFVALSGATMTIKSYGSTLSASGATGRLFFNSSSTINYFDACGNTVTNGGTASSAINIFGSCSVTGTTITAAKLVLSAGFGTTAAWTNLTGTTQQVNGLITASGTGQAANPTITYTFPTPFLQTPTVCFALQVGGTQAAVANPFTPSSLSATGVTFTYNGTPGAGSTLQVVIQCWNP